MKNRFLTRTLSLMLTLLSLMSTAAFGLTVDAASDADKTTYYFDIFLAGDEGGSVDSFHIAPIFGDTTLNGFDATARYTTSGFIVSYTDEYISEDITGVALIMNGSDSMYVEKIDTWSTANPYITTIFCGDWVNSDKTKTFNIDTDVYKITINTDTNELSGTDANVNLTLETANSEGTHSKTSPLVLNDLCNGDAFETGSTHTFIVSSNTTDNYLYRLGIKLSDASLGDKWYLNSIHAGLIQGNLASNWSYFNFNTYQWFEEDDQAYYSPFRGHSTAYLVEVKTSDASKSGTDAELLLSINEYSETVSLEDASDLHNFNSSTFERYQKEHFAIFYPTEDVIGDISSITVSNEGGGIGPNWHFDYIKITEIADGQTGKSYLFNYYNWLDSGEKVTLSRPIVTENY